MTDVPRPTLADVELAAVLFAICPWPGPGGLLI